MRRDDSTLGMRRIAYMASMYIDIVPNRRSPPAILLRESIREGGRVRKRTIANLSALPIEQAQMIRRVLKGEKLGPLESALEVVRSVILLQSMLDCLTRMVLRRLVPNRPGRCVGFKETLEQPAADQSNFGD